MEGLSNFKGEMFFIICLIVSRRGVLVTGLFSYNLVLILCMVFYLLSFLLILLVSCILVILIVC